MKFSYTLTESDIIEAMKLHNRGGIQSFVILCILAVLSSLAAIFTEYGFFSFFPLIGGIIGYLVTKHLIAPFNAKKQYKEQKALHSKITLSFIEQGITIKTIDGEDTINWSDFSKWKSTKNVVMLYLSSKYFYMIPLKSLPDVENVSQLLYENIGPKKA